MSTVTFRISSKSKRGKHLIALLSDMAKQGNDIELENNEKLPAIYRPHKLSGNYVNCWECYIRPTGY